MSLRRLGFAAILLSAAMLPLSAQADKLPLPGAGSAHVHDAAPPYGVRYSRSGKRYFVSKSYYGVRPRLVRHDSVRPRPAPRHYRAAYTPVRSYAPRRPSYRYGYRVHRHAYHHHRYQHHHYQHRRYDGFAGYPPAFRPGLVGLLSGGGMSSHGYTLPHHGYGYGYRHGCARYSYGRHCAC
jgi:hypothetical protein